MADTNSKQLFRFKNTGLIQGRLDLPFYHDPGLPVVVEKGLRVLPLPWAYNHTNVITDTCWCHRACKQYFAIFALLKLINIVITTIIIEDSLTKDEVSVTQNLYPLDALKEGSIVSKGEALFKSLHGGVSLRGVSPVDGVIKLIKTLDTDLSYWSYVPQCLNYYHVGDGSNNGMIALWSNPKTVKITPMVLSGDYSTIQGVHPPAYIRTAGPTLISLDSSFLVYPNSTDYVPKYKMRITTNYQPPRDTSKNGCPSQTIQLGLKTLDIKRLDTEGDIDYRQVTLERIPGDKNLFAFNKLYSVFAKFWQSIGYALPASIYRIPYGAFINTKYAIPQPPPGYIIKDGDSTLGVASLQWHYWSFVSNQQLGYGLASFIYYGYKRLSDNPLTNFPQSDKEWAAAAGFDSDFFRSAFPYSYKLKNDNYVIDYNNKPSQMVHSNQYPTTDYTNIVLDFARHSTMQLPDADDAPLTCPQSFMRYLLLPSTGSFSWGIYRSVYTKSISQMDALVTYTPGQWQLISSGLSLTSVILNYLKAGRLGCIITGDDILNLTIVAIAAIAYDIKLNKYLASPPSLSSFQYWKGVRITYAYPNDDCSAFIVDSGVNTNWMWKRGGLDPQYYNKWMLLGADLNYCTTVGFTQAPAILKHCLPVDSSGSAYVYCLPPATWLPGLLQLKVPNTTSDMQIKKYYLLMFPKLTASVTGYSNLPLKLDTSNSSFSLGDKDPDTGAQLSSLVIQGVAYHYKLFSACSDYQYTKQNTTLIISCNIVLGVAVNINLIAGDILTLGLLLDKVCSQLDPNNCTLIKADNLITLDGTRLLKDLTKKKLGVFNLDGRVVIVSCYKSIIALAKSKLDIIYNKLYLLYLKQANNLKYPLTPCPNCLLNKLIEVVLLVYQEDGAWTYKTILSLPDKRESILLCTDYPDGLFTIQRVALLVLLTIAYVILDLDYKLTSDKDDVILYTYYKRCMANTEIQTTRNCLQTLPDNYLSDCKYYVVLRGKCGATLNTDRLSEAVLFFTYNHKPNYPSKPKPQYPCGTLCLKPPEETKFWHWNYPIAAMSLLAAAQMVIFDLQNLTGDSLALMLSAPSCTAYLNVNLCNYAAQQQLNNCCVYIGLNIYYGATNDCITVQGNYISLTTMTAMTKLAAVTLFKSFTDKINGYLTKAYRAILNKGGCSVSLLPWCGLDGPTQYFMTTGSGSSTGSLSLAITNAMNSAYDTMVSDSAWNGLADGPLYLSDCVAWQTKVKISDNLAYLNMSVGLNKVTDGIAYGASINIQHKRAGDPNSQQAITAMYKYSSHIRGLANSLRSYIQENGCPLLTSAASLYSAAAANLDLGD